MNTLNKKQQLALKNNIILYSDKRGNVELRADMKKDTLWATQDQISQLFCVSRQNITSHLRNIFKTKELLKNSVSKDFLLTASDGKTYKVKFYNLDAIITVGYRVNSKKATQFRIWATSVLRNYLVTGHALNKHVLTTSQDKFLGLDEAITLLKSPAHPGKLKGSIVLKIKKVLVND